ncbi:MAG: lipocalin-like domain-containing protein [Alphaproteobacteria bacterium]
MTTNKLLGTWKLARWYNEAADGTITEPFGPDPVGFISYSHDGYMFAHLAITDRARYAANDMAAGTIDEDSAAMKSHVSYAGSYEIDGNHVVHHVELASFPNWTGTDQRRQIRFESGRLRLSAPFEYDGAIVTAHAVWEKPK